MWIVSNSGPILSFARAGQLDLLRDVVGSLTIPEAVYDDIVVHGAGKPGADAVQQATWITRASVRDHTVVDQLPAKLHRGEREALALAKEHGGVVLIDERAARDAAQQQGIAHFGSLRVLKEAKERGRLTAVKPILDALIASGLYLRIRIPKPLFSPRAAAASPSPAARRPRAAGRDTMLGAKAPGLLQTTL